MDQFKINQLVILARNKDSSAFAELINLTRGFAYTSVFRIVGNAEESKDIVQEAYIRVWTRLYQFNGKVTFQSWLFSILRNLSIDWIRKNQRKANAVYPDLSLEERDHPAALLEGTELNHLIHHWIARLPETQQMVFILRDMEDLPIRKVQEQTGLTESSIKSNLYVVRRKLAAYLTKKGYQLP
jgi:RNA polymerase sigma-70 factor (ECF subfamily)